MKIRLNGTVLLALLSLSACKPKNPDLYSVYTPQEAPKETYQKYEGPTRIEGEQPKDQEEPKGNKVDVPPPPPPPPEPDRYTQIDNEIYKPKVDILFVMDTSDSMKDDQKNLSGNINLFSKGFLQKKQFIDFHIGVVTAWDSISFAGLDKDCTIGQLRPLGGKAGKFKGSCEAAKNETPYITNQTESDDKKLNTLLGSTLSFGVEAFKRDEKTKKVTNDSGPQHEEIFAPVMEALRAENQSLNKNFRRTDAHLAVIFFTDTDDFDYLNIEEDAKAQDALNTKTLEDVAKNLSSSDRQKLNVSAEMISTSLLSQRKDNVTVSVYSALGRYNDWMKNKGNTQGVYKEADYYIQQPGRGPRKMVELLDLTQGTGFDLRDKNYGAKLSQIGNDIVSKSLRRVIVLDFPPEINPKRPIIVKYGKTQIIPEDQKNGWRYDYDNKTQKHVITISEGIQIKPEDGAKFSVEYTPVKK